MGRVSRKDDRLQWVYIMFNKCIAAVLPYMPKRLVWQFSKEYIAGENIDQAVANSLALNRDKIMTTIDVLGEFISTLEEAEANKKEYLEVIEAAEKAGVKGNYSLKPTFFGLLIDKTVAYEHIHEVVAKAAEYNSFVRIDMEDSPCTDDTIDMYLKLREEFPANVGVVLQVYLKRTMDDIERLSKVNTEENPVNLRICKGIYVEPASIAYKEYEKINEQFVKCVELMFQKKMYPGIATHDANVIEPVYKLIDKYKVPSDMYEFQMLYGVTPKLRKSVMDKGHKMRVYVPFGKQWFGYSTRRLKENPEMAGVIIKALFHKG